MIIKRKKLFTLTLVTLVVITTFITLSFSLFAQNSNQSKELKINDVISPLDDKMMETEPVKVVIKFWEFAEKGNFEDAKKLKTNTFGDFTIKIQRDYQVDEWEEIIYKTGLSLVSVDQITVSGETSWEIAVKVKRQDGRTIYKFHNLVKNEDGWKIFSTTS